MHIAHTIDRRHPDHSAVRTNTPTSSLTKTKKNKSTTTTSETQAEHDANKARNEPKRTNKDVVDRDVEKPHEVTNEAHHRKADGRRRRNLGEFCEPQQIGSPV